MNYILIIILTLYLCITVYAVGMSIKHPDFGLLSVFFGFAAFKKDKFCKEGIKYYWVMFPWWLLVWFGGIFVFLPIHIDIF